MSIDFTLLEISFNDHGILDEFRNFKDAYDQLKNRTLPLCPAPTGEDGCIKKVIRQYTVIVRQISLYRAIALFEGAVKAAMEENAYLLALAVRCYYESVAVLGFLHYQLKKLRFGTTDAENILEIISTLLLGLRAIKSNKSLLPINILSMIDYADKSLSSDIFQKGTNDEGYLRHEYDFFCEFAHPYFSLEYCCLRLGQR